MAINDLKLFEELSDDEAATINGGFININITKIVEAAKKAGKEGNWHCTKKSCVKF